jgi:hypothetical protein
MISMASMSFIYVSGDFLVAGRLSDGLTAEFVVPPFMLFILWHLTHSWLHSLTSLASHESNCDLWRSAI